MIQKLTTILLFILSITFSVKAENKIEINFSGETDSVIILANYYGKTFQIVDTIKLKNQSINIYNSDTLKQGVYTIARLNKSKYFDFVIGKNPSFQIQANTNNITDSIFATNSADNLYFFKYIQLNAKLYQISQKINQTNKTDLKAQREFIFSDLQLLKSEVHTKMAGSVLDIIFTAMEEPRFPSEITANEQNKYNYFKSNYWDIVALDDDRMLRTPVFHRKFEYFFDKVLMQNPDTLINEIDKLFKNEIDPEIFKYIIWELTLKYEHPKIMGLDKVFVHLVDHYYKTNKISGIEQSIMDNIIERAEKNRPLLIGKIAPNMIMVDTLNNFDALNNHFQKDYTIILFWDSDCQTCQKEIKELQKLYHSSKLNLSVFAVGTDSNLDLWKKYIREHNLDWINVNGTKSMTQDYHDLYNIYSTPTIYILNKQKQIIAKQLSVNQIQGFIHNYEQKLKLK